MNVDHLRTALVRRWYLVVLGLLATIGLGALTASIVDPTYESQASIVLVPGADLIVEGGNPLLYLGGLGQARDVLVRTLGSDAVMVPFADRHPDTTVELVADTTSSGPMIVVTVAAGSDKGSRAAMSDMLQIVPAELTRLQDQVNAPPGNARMTPLVVANDAEPEVVIKQRIRAVGAAVAMGIGLTLALTSKVDGLLMARPRGFGMGWRSRAHSARRRVRLHRRKEKAPGEGSTPPNARIPLRTNR